MKYNKPWRYTFLGADLRCLSLAATMMRSWLRSVVSILGCVWLATCNANFNFAEADKGAQMSAAYMLQRVGKTWSIDNFDSMITPDFYGSRITRADVTELLRDFRRKLGPIRSFKIIGSSERSTVGTNGAYREAWLEYTVQFQKASGTIDLVILNEDQGWRLQNLHINSRVFL